MRCLLISPSHPGKQRLKPSWMPLGLSFLAAVLRGQGHETIIFDRFARLIRRRGDDAAVDREMMATIRDFRPDLIGLQTISPLIFDTISCVNLIRPQFKGLLYAGGHHATALPELTLERITGLDGLVVGEGEMPLACLARGDDPSSIPGVWFRDDEDRGQGTNAWVNRDLDQLPFPALDLLDMDLYLRPGVNPIKGHFLSTICLLASRGCPQRCEFCSESLTYGRGVRFHSPDYVAEWLAEVLGKYQMEAVYFHDNDFLISEGWAREICERIMKLPGKRPLKWGVQARSDHINRDILRVMRRAGCVTVEIGVETSSQSLLDKVEKRASVAMHEKAIALCRQEGLHTHAYMLAGLEGETLADLQENLDWAKRIKPDSFQMSRLMIHPGTRLYDRLGCRFFQEHDWNESEIRGHYQHDYLSSIGVQGLDDWMKHRYKPYRQLRHHQLILSANPVGKIVRHYGRRLVERLHGE